MKRLLWTLGAVVMGLLLLSRDTLADHEFASWRKSNLTVYTNSYGTVMEPYVLAAIENWNGHGLTLTAQPTTDCDMRRGAITLCVYTEQGGLGGTFYYSHGSRMSGVLIHLNTWYYEHELYPGGAVPWMAGYEWDPGNVTVPGTWLPCHELGHALGLGHDNVLMDAPAFAEHRGCLNNSIRYPAPSAHDYESLAVGH